MADPAVPQDTLARFSDILLVATAIQMLAKWLAKFVVVGAPSGAAVLAVGVA